MKVEIEVLQEAVTRLLAHAKERHGATCEVPDDLYWFVPQPQLTDPTSAPSDLTLGALQDDWEAISAIGRGDKEPLGYALVWASSLLRAIGDRTP